MSENKDLSARRSALNAGQLAALKRRLSGPNKAEASVPAIERSTKSHFALSSAQWRQWVLWEMNPDSTAYHLCGGLSLRGRLDIDAFRRAFQQVTLRHPSLRTVFKVDIDGSVEQLMDDGALCEIAYLDLSGRSVPESANSIDHEVERLSGMPFDLHRGPLMRSVLIRTGLNDHRLLVVMHHIICDEWSTQIILREIGHYYRAFSTGKSVHLPAPPIRYGDYAEWQTRWLAGAEHQGNLHGG